MQAGNFKLKRYNEGGYLDFLKKNPGMANSLFTGTTGAIGALSEPGYNPSFANFSSTFSQNRDRSKGLDKGLNVASGIASAIPGIGTAAAAGLQGVKLLSDLTRSDEDEYGVHKSGFLSTFDPQTQLRKDRDRFQDQSVLDMYSQEEQAGNQARAAIGGYKSAPYGRHGMKMKVSRFSKLYKK